MRKIKLTLALIAACTSINAHELPENILIHEPLVFFSNPNFNLDNNPNNPDNNPNSNADSTYHLKVDSVGEYDEITLSYEDIWNIYRLEMQDEQMRGMVGEGAIELEPDDFFPTHDGLDHDTRIAIIAAMAICESTAILELNTYPNGSIPVFTGPESFVINYTETSSYSINEGISFYCKALIPVM